MCGIVGFTGTQQAAPILLSGLSKLEYRGYDSAGIAVRDGDKLAEVDVLGIWLKNRMRVELCVVPVQLDIHAGQRMVSQVRSMHTRMCLVIVRVPVPVKWNLK